jgi:hypothetical protein
VRRLLVPLAALAVGLLLGSALAYGLYLALPPVAYPFVPVVAFLALSVALYLRFVRRIWRP